MAYKITDVQKVKLNGRDVILFKYWQLIQQAYVFCGTFSAPARTPKKRLIEFAL